MSITAKRTDGREHGVSLIELMVAVGILGILGIAAMTFFSHTEKTARRMNFMALSKTINGGVVERLKADVSKRVKNCDAACQTTLGISVTQGYKVGTCAGFSGNCLSLYRSRATKSAAGFGAALRASETRYGVSCKPLPAGVKGTLSHYEVSASDVARAVARVDASCQVCDYTNERSHVRVVKKRTLTSADEEQFFPAVEITKADGTKTENRLDGVIGSTLCLKPRGTGYEVLVASLYVDALVDGAHDRKVRAVVEPVVIDAGAASTIQFIQLDP